MTLPKIWVSIISLGLIGLNMATSENETNDPEDDKMILENNATWHDFELAKELEISTRVCPADWSGKLPHIASCHQYYRCENGILQTENCSDNLIFDGVSGECLNEDKGFCKFNSSIDVCRHQVDGYYPNYTETCQKYYRCQGGLTIGEYSCPEYFGFSYTLQICRPQNQVSCAQPVCHSNENNFFWMPGSFCRSYYYCQNGTALLFSCPDGKTFNQDSMNCVKGGGCYEPICIGKPDGDHPDTTTKCKRFLTCRGGNIDAVTSCPPSLIHNGRSCTLPSLSQCKSPEETAVAVETIRDDCSGYSDGPHVIPVSECRRYQVCQDGKAIAKLSCPVGERFNGRYCGPKNITPCEDQCHDKADGYHADHAQGCRKYHYCRQGETTEHRTCPEGSLFSGRMCLPSPLVTCRQMAEVGKNPCIGLQDGFHADYLGGCSEYYYCSKYVPLLKTSCLKNLLWNGKQCVEPKDMLCLGPMPSSMCHGKQTGLYQDMASACVKYFYCHRGNSTILSCTKGKVFDGENCVSEDEYTCPSNEPNTCINKSDGYRIEGDSGCRAYYFCSNGQKLSYACPQDQRFNGSECVDKADYSCSDFSKGCQGKGDGYYAEKKNQCRTYFYCQGGYRLNTFNCGPRKAFDGVKCILVQHPSSVCQVHIKNSTETFDFDGRS